MNMIKILQYGLGPHIGGIETYLLKLAQNIDQSKYQLDFLIEEGDEPCFYKELQLLHCGFHKVTPRRRSITSNRRDLERLFCENRFDILHCHLNSLSYIEPVRVALKHKVKTIVHSRNAGSMNRLHSKLLHYYNYIQLPKDKIKLLAVSEQAGKWMFGNADYQVVNNGIDINRFRFDEQVRIKIRKELGFQDEFVIGHVGSFTKQKNHEFILKVFSETVKVNPSARLILIGEGKLEATVRKEIGQQHLTDQIILLGNREDIPQLLAAMDYFLFPSYYEGFPNALLEAQTSGLPCLISDRITDEVIVSQNVKSLSLQANPKQWADIINTAPEGGDRKVAYQNTIEKGFSQTREIEKLQNIYHDLLITNG